MMTKYQLDKDLMIRRSLMSKSLRLDSNSMPGSFSSTTFLLSGKLIVKVFYNLPNVVFVYLVYKEDPYTNIKIDLGMTAEKYGIVTGTVFTLINSVFGLLMGYLADKFNRKWMLLGTTIMYTLMTLATAYTHNFTEVLIPRIMFSFFMAACIPMSVSLINDYFKHEQRGRANSLFAFGIYLGGGLSSLSGILNKNVG